eukprot:3492940-Rhodomonas_salina.1
MREWDPGAYALFDESLQRQVRVPASVRSGLDENVGSCLLLAHSRGEGPNACLLEFLSARNETRETYFAYEPAAEQQSSIATDACQVFTGPAQAGSQAFQECLDEYETEGCEIAPFVWSARSSNRVPVASAHTFVYSDKADRRAIADNMLTQAHRLATAALEAAANYSNSRVEAYLFSVEGDFVHQLFDCVVMGAFARADLWPRDELGVLSVPS